MVAVIYRHFFQPRRRPGRISAQTKFLRLQTDAFQFEKDVVALRQRPFSVRGLELQIDFSAVDQRQPFFRRRVVAPPETPVYRSEGV